jgi:hypothetical protein
MTRYEYHVREHGSSHSATTTVLARNAIYTPVQFMIVRVPLPGLISSHECTQVDEDERRSVDLLGSGSYSDQQQGTVEILTRVSCYLLTKRRKLAITSPAAESPSFAWIRNRSDQIMKSFPITNPWNGSGTFPPL